jgi:hypothetical protein
MTAADVAPSGGTSVSTMLAEGAGWLSAYLKGESPAPGTKRARVEQIETLRKTLEDGPILKQPELRSVRGVFYPAVSSRRGCGNVTRRTSDGLRGTTRCRSGSSPASWSGHPPGI